MTNEKLVTHYDNLKVANNAPIAVIRAAYRALVQQHHPDKCPDQALAERRIKIINKAYAVLSDPDQRRQHDAWIADQLAGCAAGDTQPAQASHAHARSEQQPSESAGAHRFLDSIRARVTKAGGMVERLALIGGAVLLVYVGFAEKQDRAVQPAARPAIEIPESVPAPTQSALPDIAAMEEATRCFWIYAPIAQVGREFPHDGLLQFAQARVRWFDAFLLAHKDDPDFDRTIEAGLYRHKTPSLHFHDALSEALATRDQRMFATAMDAALACDQSLGIPTQLVPRL